MLGDIFDFILSNIAFIAFVAAGIFGMFNRKKEQEETNNRTEGPIPTLFDLEEVFEKKEPEQQPSFYAPPPDSKEKEQFETQLLKPQLAAAPEEPEQELWLQPQTGNRRKLSISQKNVVKGIIWSEILGPPRAKKQYSTMSYRKR